MRIFKKLGAAMLAVVMMFVTLAVTAFAADTIGTNPTTLKDGVKVTDQIPYSGQRNYDNGANYIDYKFTAPADGKMVITFDALINDTFIDVYNASNYEVIKVDSIAVNAGTKEYNRVVWNTSSGVASYVLTFKVTKGDYYIRARRIFSRYNWEAMGEAGNGRIHITAEMQKPEAPEVKVTAKTFDSLTLGWNEPVDVTAYDILYKEKTATKWTTVSNIKDNTYTIKNLKASTTYYYCIRAKAGGIVGKVGKTYAAKTASSKLTAPSVSGTKRAIMVSWKPVTGATSYKLGYSLDKKTWYYVTTTSTSAAFPVTSGKTYYYTVQAKNSASSSAWSTIKSVKA